jgi:NADPH-dependent curcumin reductase CurA
MPGMTAYVGLLDIGQPKAGETVVVSSAAGAVGSVVGQIAKIKGCRAVGIAGSDEKCAFVTDELGFDACVNYKAGALLRSLRRACPDGIDVYFENVGGETLDIVLRLINVGARIPLIGLISQYNATTLVPGPNLVAVLIKRAMIQGMIVGDHAGRTDAFLRDVSAWLEEGKIKYRETIVPGLENAPRAFIGLFHGENIGKLLVQVADDPAQEE